MDTAAIGCDWGTSSLRAYRLAFDGTVIDHREEPLGIMAIPAGGFEAAFEATIGDWLDHDPQVPVILSGMVGSRQGWREAPYLECPARLANLVDAMRPVPVRQDRQLLIAPGLCCRDHDGTPDVMRGEEVQILGALETLGNRTASVCLPGTHSKWARVEHGTVTGFTTYMTGEVFEAVRDHTILGRMMDTRSWDDDAFSQGLERASIPGGVIAHLFGLRAKGLFGEIDDKGAAAYLSGLLIGHEVRAACDQEMTDIVLIGSGRLTELYACALCHIGRRTRAAPPHVAAAGHARLAGLSIGGNPT